MEFMQFVITGITFLTATSGAVWWLYRKAIKPFVVRLTAMVELVEAQLTPNHGSSLVDRVNQTQKGVARLESNHDNLDKRVKVLENARNN